MRPTILISIKEEHSWQSCKHITKGLTKSYETLDPQSVQIMAISNSADLISARVLARKILKANPTLIVFLDTWAVYGKVLHELAAAYSTKTRVPTLRFHIYGDFTLNSALWLKLSRYLSQFKVEWACASEQQRRLVESLVLNKDSTWTCPFPVEKLDFEFDLGLRQKTRQSLGIKSEIVFVYTGRLSLQKNILAALRTINSLENSFLKKCKFIFAGPFDDLTPPLECRRIPAGGFFKIWQNELNRLSPLAQEKTLVLQELDRASLRSLYCASDAYFSLSLVHDEDFGMAPAEAAVTGLPLILTKWGGYAGFGNLGLAGQWIPVHLQRRGPVFDLMNFQNALHKISKQKSSFLIRKRRARQAQSLLSVESVSNLILLRDAQPGAVTRFKGFKDKMEDLSKLFEKQRGHLIFPELHRGSIYEQVYRHYVQF